MPASQHGEHLLREEHGAFGHGINVPGETQILEPSQKIRLEALRLRQPLDVVRRECRLFKVGKGLIESRGDQKITLGGKSANEELENRCPVHSVLPVRLQHSELVPVGQQRAIIRVHN